MSQVFLLSFKISQSAVVARLSTQVKVYGSSQVGKKFPDDALLVKELIGDRMEN